MLKLAFILQKPLHFFDYEELAFSTPPWCISTPISVLASSTIASTSLRWQGAS